MGLEQLIPPTPEITDDDGQRTPVSVQRLVLDFVMEKHFIIWLALMLLVVGGYAPDRSAGKAEPVGPDQAAPDYRFVSGTSTKNIPFKLNANKPYLRVQINNSGPYWFFLDTGASFNVLDKDRAQALGIPLSGRSEERGAGERTVTSAIGTGVSLRLPGLEFSKENITVLPLNAAIYLSEGRTIDGLLGYDFFKRLVVEIDYVRQSIDVYDPQTYKYNGPGESIPLVIDREHAFVSTTLVLSDGRRVSGRFMVDTGWRSALTLNAPFVVAEKLLATPQRTIEATTGVGIGGATQDTVGRIESLQLGRYMIKKPVTAFSKAKQGILADNSFSGIIGGDMLRRFKVVFDYAHQRMIIEPNVSFNEPYEFDMSGLFVTAEGKDFKTFKVYRVLPNSPALDSGIREGDVIVEVDEGPATELTLEHIRRIFKQGEGKEHLLRIQRGERLLPVKIKLRRLI